MSGSRSFHRFSVVIEDEALLRLDLEDALRTLGFWSIPLVSPEGASTLDMDVCELAVICGSKREAIRTALARNVPVVICSGSPPDEEFSSAVHLAKPYSEKDLADAVHRAIAPHGVHCSVSNLRGDHPS